MVATEVRSAAPVYASLARRLAAFGVDYGVIAAYMAVLALVAMALGAGDGRWDRAFAHPVGGQAVSFLVLTLPVIVYFALFESAALQATPGKRLLRIRVAAAGAVRLPRHRAFARAALKFLPWEISHGALRHTPGWPGDVEAVPAAVWLVFGLAWLLAGAYVGLPLFDARGRTPYDRLAGSVVIVDGPVGADSSRRTNASP